MHSLLARDLATAVADDRAQLASRRRVPPAPAAPECGCDIVAAHSVMAVMRPAAKARLREAEVVCV
jgi:hypothetical protein